MPEAIKKLIWPLAALVLLLAFNAVANREFFHIEFVDGRLAGPPVNVSRFRGSAFPMTYRLSASF